MATKKEDKKKELPFIGKADPDVLFVDYLAIGSRPDGNSLLRFGSVIQEGIREQVRIMTPTQHVKKMIDAMCKTINYYPERPQKKDKGDSTSDRPKGKAH